MLLLERMGLSPAGLTAAPQNRSAAPTFGEYVPVVSAVAAGTRRAYGSYRNRVVEHWGGRRLDEPTPSEIRQLMTYVKLARRNARGGRSAAEHLAAALRCLYQRAVDDGLISQRVPGAADVHRGSPPGATCPQEGPWVPTILSPLLTWCLVLDERQSGWTSGCARAP